MADDDPDVKHLKRCFQDMIAIVHQTVEQLRPKKSDSESDTLYANTVLNTGVFTFTLNKNDDEEMSILRTNLESAINKHRPHLSSICQRYLLEFLCQYHYDDQDKKFTDSFTMESLYPFECALEGALTSIDTFVAAWQGKLAPVRDFIKDYPTFKDKPGLHGTTLLYSAAKNNHLRIVKYLVEHVQCAVNAQNLQDLAKALSGATVKGGSGHFNANPSAASTALHGACFDGHLEIVEYLIEHEADYFILNQAHETPIENGKRHDKIREFFEKFLILGYSQISRTLPEVPITEKTTVTTMFDCIWEHKSLSNNEWHSFSADESKELSQSLIVLPDQEMKRDIYLSVRSDTYTVSLIRFLRSGKNRDPTNNLAWVRCRGSSIANFDCYALWQIMIVEHPNLKPNDLPSLEPVEVPRSYDSRFQLQLNCWYNCTPQISAKLDHAINYRRKKTPLDVDLITSDILEFDLQLFTFNNEKKTVVGFIRWLPKLISRKQQDSSRIRAIDNFQNLANADPIPFTTARLKQLSQPSDTQSIVSEDDASVDGDLDSPVAQTLMNVDEGDEDTFIARRETNNRTNDGFWSVKDCQKDDDTESVASDDARSEILDDYLSEASKPSAALSALVESISAHRQEIDVIKADLERKDQENRILQEQLDAANEEMDRQLNDDRKKTDKLKKEQESDKRKQEQELNKLIQKISQLTAEQRRIEAEKVDAQKIERAIKAVDYKGIEAEVIQDIFTPKFSLILDHLKKTKTQFGNQLMNKIPQMRFDRKTNVYIVTIIGFPEHHETFKLILKQAQQLLRLKQGAVTFYERKLDKMKNGIRRDLSKVKPKTQLWKQYEKLFVQFINEKSIEYAKMFSDCIRQKADSLIEQCISNDMTTIRNEIYTQTNNFMKDNNILIKEVDSLKLKALEEFIQQNITNQRTRLEKKPTPNAIDTLEKFIGRVRNTMKTNPRYVGHEVKHYSLIPDLLQRLMLYYCSFKIQLPLYESSIELLDKIEKNTVVTIATSTGSGKSTLLPGLLAAEGYDKIIVTQPRRLPCMLISERVNTTMTMVSDPNSQKLAGWAVAGAENNQNAKVIYLTDGLLKERLLHDENFITKDTQLNRSIVFFIDEVHERSVNIDHCLALLARILTLHPDLKSKIKLIISSATLDTSVPKLFRQIPQVTFAAFEMPQMGTIYPVAKVARPNENILNIVQELYQDRRRYDQILCFVSSVKEVNECVTLLKKITSGAITAYPLVQSQQASVQQEYIETGSVFFSTTVAETSLTFPQLKFVIDTGMINVPVYDPQSKRTVLKVGRAAESTIKQRLGRLGRTQPGTYYSLYNFKVEDQRYPIPQICQSDLMNIEFSLRKSPLHKGLEYMKNFLPDKPPQPSIDHTVQELRNLGILENAPSESLTSHGRALAKLPDFGSLAMSKCVLAALKEYNCGRDLIVLSSILSVLNTTTVLKSVPQQFKSADGDFMTLLNVMDQILLVKKSVKSNEFRLEPICQSKGLTGIQHIIKQALRRQISLEKSFNLSPDFRTQAQVKSNDWELIAKSLLVGYYTNVFASTKELKDRHDLFVRYNDSIDSDIASLDSQSVLARTVNKTPPALVIARDIRYSTSVRSKAILSFVGEIKPDWVEYQVTRNLQLNSEEETRLNTNNLFKNAVSKFSHRISMALNNTTKSAKLSGPAGTVFNGELHLRQNMEEEFQFQLDCTNPLSPAKRTNLTRNLESIMKMPYIFKPMQWRWENQKQVTITINCNSSTKTCDVTVKGRNLEYKNVKKEFDSFLKWLQDCAVIRHPNSGVPPRVFRPQVRSKYLDIEERIARITDSKRTTVDLYNGAKGTKATRETRMEVVAWIAVCLFSCKLEGGFVRDWVIGNYTARPAGLTGNPKAWISYTNGVPYLNREVVPADLDCHLPTHAYFDIDRFHDELYKYDITCKVSRQDWRYVLLIDEDAPTGPFTMDLIEPHVALTHDRIDFDVNDLSLEKDYTHEIGMRVDIQQRPYLIEIEAIVDNIKNKRFQVLRPIDNFLTERIDKMINIRHWTQMGEPFSVVPNPNPKYSAVLVTLPPPSKLYRDLQTEMQKIGSVTIVSIEQVKNPLLEDTYESMKKLIAKQCKGSNPNERSLFHGTKGEGIDGIRDDGFDDRYFSPTGNWGHGAYFADDPKKSHGYTAADTTDQTHVMYYCKVVLGVESKQTATNQQLVSAPKDTHSVVGTLGGFTEYIVYRYGQALPYMKITYKG
ncbi:unnamed protein product [Rotaria socialis]|uniref:Poly [ADP-ribose] polymerase n=1 Tax=Rotaria socialis TaxID=392032 RepID=A0A818NN05_9BILA|nr:unnamed protein product [Rotaria socialis]